MEFPRDAELLKDKRGFIDGREFFSRSPFFNPSFLGGIVATLICIFMALCLAVVFRNRVSLGIVWVLASLCGVLLMAWTGALRHIRRLRSLYKDGLIGTVEAGSPIDIALGVAANAIIEWLASLACALFLALSYLWMLWGMRLGH